MFRQPRLQMRLKVMAEEEKAARFGEIPGSRVWPALMAELDEFIVDVSDDALNEDNPNKLFKVAGGQEYLLDFKRKLLQREAAARGTQRKDAESAEVAEEADGAEAGT